MIQVMMMTMMKKHNSRRNWRESVKKEQQLKRENY
jgi:hypothetical protein